MPPDAATLTAWVETLGAHALQLYGATLIVLLMISAALWWLARRYTVPTQTSRLSPGAYLLIRLALGFVVVVAGAIIFAEAAEVLGSSADARRAGDLDQVFSNAVRKGISPTAYLFFSNVTHLADTATLTGLGIAGTLALLWLGRRWLAGVVLVAIAGNALLNVTLKTIFARARPLHDPATELVRGFSFPSGHSSGAVVAYGMLAYVLIRCLGRRTLRASNCRWCWRPRHWLSPSAAAASSFRRTSRPTCWPVSPRAAPGWRCASAAPNGCGTT